MTLVLGRGGYRPKHRSQAEGLVQLYHEMELGYCWLITITTDNLTTTNEYRTGVGAHLDIFCRMQDAWAIAEYTDPTHNPMIPHCPRSSRTHRPQDLWRLLGSLPGRLSRASTGPAIGVAEVPARPGHYPC